MITFSLIFVIRIFENEHFEYCNEQSVFIRKNAKPETTTAGKKVS